MLFMSSANRIIRIHGPYVSEKEIEKITNSLRAQGNPEYVEDSHFSIEPNKQKAHLTEGNEDDEDELFNQAVEIIKTEGKASTSFYRENFKSVTIELLELLI